MRGKLRPGVIAGGGLIVTGAATSTPVATSGASGFILTPVTGDTMWVKITGMADTDPETTVVLSDANATMIGGAVDVAQGPFDLAPGLDQYIHLQDTAGAGSVIVTLLG